MSRFQPENGRGRLSRNAFALLLATSALASLHTSPALAQETELRGAVSDSAIADDQRRKTRDMAEAAQAQAEQAATNSPAIPDYLPASPGAAPDEAGSPSSATGSIFDDAAAVDDTFGEDAVPLPRYRPRALRPAIADDNAADDDAQKKTATDRNETAAPGEEENAEAEPDEQESANPRAVTVDSAEREELDPGAERTGAIEGHDKKPEEDPFAATGIRVGSFVMRPAIEQGITATSNADSSHDGEPAVLSETVLRLNAASDWATNSATIDGYGIFRKTLSGDEVEDAQGRIEGTLNIDLDHEMRAIGKLGYEAVPESASSPVVIEGTVSQPLRQTIDGSLGIEKNVGKLRFGLTGAIERDLYGDAKLSTGDVLSQKDRDSTLYTATLRGGYEISPAITPFAEVEVGRRQYDQDLDSSGFARSADRLGARAGMELDLGEKLNGEFSAGWIREAIDDDRLPAVSGATVNADLEWSPERGTVIGLNGTTTVEGTTTADEAGSILYSGRLSAERQIRSNLTGTAVLGADWRDYMGSDDHDLTLSAEAGLTYWLNRYAGITTRARTEKLTSSLPDRDAATNSVFLGLRLQR